MLYLPLPPCAASSDTGCLCRDLLIAGLEKLEYRGYDSAGISLIVDGRIETVRAVGNLTNLRRAVTEANGNGAVAGRGRADRRARPHALGDPRQGHGGERAPHGDCEDRIHIVLNGIVENHPSFAASSWTRDTAQLETDAEIVAHLIERHDEGDLTEAVRAVFNELRGLLRVRGDAPDHPGVIVGA